ncbi:MAG: hypothetical protein DRO89_03455 [Candidatus Altiarchaeales archaeon]|nr:MAG: hypothetical protein DRO89_03455 [Candidatus Altiarchaeales archaeon]
MKAMKGLTLGIVALIAFGLVASTASAYFGCIVGAKNAICFNKGASDILGNETKTFSLYQADLSGLGYEPVKAEIQFTVKNPSNVTVGVKYGINGKWYQTVLVEPGETSTIKSNVDLDDLELGQRNEVAFKTTVEVEEILPIKGHLAVRWARE